MKTLGIIPARFASTRLEGKPLKNICGKTMIQRVYEQAAQALEHVYVATDDSRIEAEVNRFGGNVVMTSTGHTTGTNRCVEAYNILQKKLNIDFKYSRNTTEHQKSNTECGMYVLFVITELLQKFDTDYRAILEAEDCGNQIHFNIKR